MWECKNLLNLWEEVKRWKQLGMKHHKYYYNVNTLVWGKKNNITVFLEILVRKDVVDGNFPGQTEGLTRYKLMYM